MHLRVVRQRWEVVPVRNGGGGTVASWLGTQSTAASLMAYGLKTQSFCKPQLARLTSNIGKYQRG